MGLFDNAKSAAVRTKLKAEIVLLEREMAVRKKAFGVVLFDLMASIEAKGSKTPFHDKDSLLLPCYEAAKADVNEIQQRKDSKQTELELVELERMKGEHKPTDTAAQKAKAAGNWIAYAGTETKLSANLALLDREMKIRKEAFGVDVYDAAVSQLLQEEHKSPGTASASAGIKNAVVSAKNMLNKVTGSTNVSQVTAVATVIDIRACIRDIMDDVERIQTKKDRKLQEIALS